MKKLQNIQQVHELRKTNSVIILSNFHRRITSKLKIIETRKITLTAGFLGVEFWNTESLRNQFFYDKTCCKLQHQFGRFLALFPSVGRNVVFCSTKNIEIEEVKKGIILG